MQIYLVGGAVRDQKLGLPVYEKDYVVVGSTPKEMLKRGFSQVGKDFPVFLHPKTKEEFALARTERKQGQGYHGFTCKFDPSVTLEEDLLRRDLTINAMAQDSQGNIIDPYGGLDDLKAGYFRHVSPAFIEDPLRILRVARFAAKLPHFKVHPSTLSLMQSMVIQGELKHLAKERYWKEIYRVAELDHPLRFFQVMTEVGGHHQLFPQSFKPQYVQDATVKTQDPIERLAMGYWHCERIEAQQSLALIAAPNVIKELVNTLIIINALHTDNPSFSARCWLNLADQTDLWRRPERFKTAMKLAANKLPHWPVSLVRDKALTLSQHPWGNHLPKSLKGPEISQWIHQKKYQYILNILDDQI